jgi:hypothetical protein
MAIVHRTTLTPSKLELLEVWLPRQEWAEGTGSPTLIGSYRFDDPAGEVGIEALLVETEIGVVHVPLSYRAAPLEGAEAHLVGTMEHGVLGQRWAYDGEFDPVWRAAALEAIFTGGTNAELNVAVDGQIVDTVEPAVRVLGTGSGSVPSHAALHIARRIGDSIGGDEQLNGTWATGHGVLASGKRL